MMLLSLPHTSLLPSSFSFSPPRSPSSSLLLSPSRHSIHSIRSCSMLSVLFDPLYLFCFLMDVSVVSGYAETHSLLFLLPSRSWLPSLFCAVLWLYGAVGERASDGQSAALHCHARAVRIHPLLSRHRLCRCCCQCRAGPLHPPHPRPPSLLCCCCCLHPFLSASSGCSHCSSAATAAADGCADLPFPILCSSAACSLYCRCNSAANANASSSSSVSACRIPLHPPCHTTGSCSSGSSSAHVLCNAPHVRCACLLDVRVRVLRTATPSTPLCCSSSVPTVLASSRCSCCRAVAVSIPSSCRRCSLRCHRCCSCATASSFCCCAAGLCGRCCCCRRLSPAATTATEFDGCPPSSPLRAASTDDALSLPWFALFSFVCPACLSLLCVCMLACCEICVCLCVCV